LEDLLALMLPMVRERTEYWIGCDVSPCVLELYWRLRGMEDALLGMAGDPGLANEMFARCGDFSFALDTAACRRYPLDGCWTGDDIGGQRAMMFTPPTWRRLAKPHLARVFDVGRELGLPVACQCCGALRPMIAALAETGHGHGTTALQSPRSKIDFSRAG
jgi:uroporphyrinogen decarboxylase